MKRFLLIAIVYFAVAVVFVCVARPNGLEALQNAWNGTLGLAPVFGRLALMLLAVGVVVARLTHSQTVKSILSGVVMAFVATLAFQSGFNLIKTSMPLVVPFYGDVALAQWDAALHGGHDPWAFTHWIAGYLPMEWVIPVYLHVWMWPALCLPVIVAALDPDRQRAGRALVLYVMAWVLIGNILALAGMSAGPVFYDRIYGGDRFGELTRVIAATPVMSSYFGPIQDLLWAAYSEGRQFIGSGISAFPSVHVSVAMVGALYLWEHSRALGSLGVAFVAVILFLSIYSGYHYALDGYVSIAVIWGAWALMRRQARGLRPDCVPKGQLA